MLIPHSRQSASFFLRAIFVLACVFALAAPRVVAAPSNVLEQSSRGEPLVLLQAVQLSGVTVFAEEDLRSLYADAVGKELSFEDLEGIATGITRYYRDHGYLVARAHLPAQTILDGVVHIAVVEGRYGALRVENTSAMRDRTWQVLLSPLTPGAVIEQGVLDRALLLLNDLPGVTVSSSLQPGEAAGESDLIVRIADTDRWRAQVQLDNNGNHLTGARRAQVSGSYHNAVGLGDRIYGSALLSEGGGLHNAQLGFAHSVSSLPLQTDSSVAVTRYELDGPFSLLDATGETLSADLTVRYPIERISGRTLSVFGGLSFKDAKNRELGDTTNKRLLSLSVGMSDDRMAARGSLSYTLRFTYGNLELAPKSLRDADALTANTQGGFTKVDGSANYTQRIDARTHFAASAKGQVAFNNLDETEKFSLGGSSGVRAYPPGEASGDSGLLARASLAHAPAWFDTFPGTWLVQTFVDVGTVKTHARPWVGADTGGRTLMGAGVGINWAYQPYSAGIEYGCKLGSEVAKSAPDEPCRLWARMAIAF